MLSCRNFRAQLLSVSSLLKGISWSQRVSNLVGVLESDIKIQRPTNKYDPDLRNPEQFNVVIVCPRQPLFTRDSFGGAAAQPSENRDGKIKKKVERTRPISKRYQA